MKKAPSILILFFLGFLFCPWLSFKATAQDSALDTLLARLEEKLSGYRELTAWKASAITTEFRVDKNWQHEKATVIEKTVSVKDGIRIEEVHSALEKKGSTTKDVTEKYRKEAQKAREKAEKNKDKARDSGRRRELTMEELFPFQEDRRTDYTFTLLEESVWNGQPVIQIKARSKKREKDFWDGTYTFHKDSLEILRAEIKRAKNSGPVKRFEMDIHFTVLPGNFLAMEQVTLRIHVGLIIKNIRMEVIEQYDDFEILQQ